LCKISILGPSKSTARAGRDNVMTLKGPTGPHVVHFSAVKEVVEIESGRFEFFKQMLTMGLAAIAGLAAIFTEPDKIPGELVSRITIVLFAVSAIVVVIWSAMGISTYANHLRDVDNLSRNPDSEDLKKKLAQTGRGMLSHAKVTLVSATVGALALIAFAGAKLFILHPSSANESAEKAIAAANRFVKALPGNPEIAGLDHFQIEGPDYVVTYFSNQDPHKYIVRVGRDSNEVSEATRSQ
jgi:hypothetical protein